MLLKDVTAEGLDLALKSDVEAGPLETEVKPADAGEERRDGIGQLRLPQIMCVLTRLQTNIWPDKERDVNDGYAETPFG